jgi:RNA polymerase sigma-70 factor (ECF subfamily)
MLGRAMHGYIRSESDIGFTPPIAFVMDRLESLRLDQPDTFERMYAAYRRPVLAAAYRVLGDADQAEDVTQDVFLRVWRNPRAFDSRRGNLGAYLRLMARSRAVDVWRERQAAGRAADRLRVAVAGDDGRTEDSPVEAMHRSEDHATVGAALRGLPDSQREAVVLAFWGGLTGSQIAHRTSVSLGTAKSRTRLGMARLRAELVS